MRRFALVSALVLCLCGATWSTDRDVVTLKVTVYAPEPDGVAATVVVDGADVLLPVGNSTRKTLAIAGYPKGVRLTITATAVK